jgi:hypothetical protein
MRGWILCSILFVAACGPAKPAVDPSTVDDSRKDEPAEAWGSSETADAAKSPPPHASAFAASHSTESTSAESTSTTKTAKASTASGGAASSSSDSDAGPHVPNSVGGGGYDRTEIEVVLKRAARQVKANCGAATDDEGSHVGPWGKTMVTVRLGHNGHSKGGAVPAPFDGKATGRCAGQAFANLIYPPFPGSDADVDWPVELVKP